MLCIQNVYAYNVCVCVCVYIYIYIMVYTITIVVYTMLYSFKLISARCASLLAPNMPTVCSFCCSAVFIQRQKGKGRLTAFILILILPFILRGHSNLCRWCLSQPVATCRIA
jgi:hypothetical protein